MKLRLDLDGIETTLEIKKYRKSTKANWDEEWCKVSFTLNCKDIINYCKTDDELLLCSEVEELSDTIKTLLLDEMKQRTELSFIEPDFCFIFNPKRIDPQLTLFEDNPRVIDVDAEWKVYFWNDGLTDNYLSLSLDAKDIENLKNYLNLITGMIEITNPVIEAMISRGILCE